MEKTEKITTALVVMLSLVVVLNAYQMSQLRSAAAAAPLPEQKASFDASRIIPTGVPPVYGKELGVSFDDVSASNPALADQTIDKLAKLDQSITLSGSELQRYINVGLHISCEYCCDAPAIIYSDGSPACGCAHSFAMRGLAKYLIQKHGSEYTDSQIMEELGKWKTLFFPAQTEQKAGVLFDGGIDVNYVNLASDKYKGIEKGSAGAMVGDC